MVKYPDARYISSWFIRDNEGNVLYKMFWITDQYGDYVEVYVRRKFQFPEQGIYFKLGHFQQKFDGTPDCPVFFNNTHEEIATWN